ncbi:hypothetical protein EMIT0111MI5_60008 [Burkholderia sp. IT-111MI5]
MRCDHTRICVLHHGRIPFSEPDPETGCAHVPVESSASCFKFVIVHYVRVSAARAASGKTDRSSRRAPTRRTESRDLQGSPQALEATPHGGSGRLQLQFATNAKHARGGFSLHCFHATCMPAVADRGAENTAPAGESK